MKLEKLTTGMILSLAVACSPTANKGQTSEEGTPNSQESEIDNSRTNDETTALNDEVSTFEPDLFRSQGIRDALNEAFCGKDTMYELAFADLNNDGQDEVVAYVYGSGYCGSAGCTLAVLTPRKNGYEVVGDTTVTQPPIRVLKTYTNGWRDLSVGISGG